MTRYLVAAGLAATAMMLAAAPAHRRFRSSRQYAQATQWPPKRSSTRGKMLGKPYKYAGDTPAGFDCSGLVSTVTVAPGLRCRATRSRNAVCRCWCRRAACAKAICCSSTRRQETSHVGMYIGNGRFIHAPSSGGKCAPTASARSSGKSILSKPGGYKHLKQKSRHEDTKDTRNTKKGKRPRYRCDVLVMCRGAWLQPQYTIFPSVKEYFRFSSCVFVSFVPCMFALLV